MSTSLAEITDLARDLAQSRRSLSQAVGLAQAAIDEVKTRHLHLIETLASQAGEDFDELYAAVEASADLFKKPRTRELHGIKVGFAKGKGRIEWADAGQVVKLIRRHLPDQADLLIKSTEAPVKSALNSLPAADLRRIGVTVTEAGDRVVVTPVDGDLDRLVAALLSDPEPANEEE